jgi:hypothetical protein
MISYMRIISVLLSLMLISFNVAYAQHNCDNCHDVKIEKADCHDHESEHQPSKSTKTNTPCLDCNLCLNTNIFVQKDHHFDFEPKPVQINNKIFFYQLFSVSNYISELLRPPIA